MSTLGGSIAGAGIQVGVYTVSCKLANGKINYFTFILKGIEGAVMGGNACYLGAEMGITCADSSQPMITQIDANGQEFSVYEKEREKLKNIIKNIKDLNRDDVDSIMKHSNARKIGASLGHADSHILEYNDSLKQAEYTSPDNKFIQSHFISGEQQKNYVLKTLKHPDNLTKLTNLLKVRSVTLSYAPIPDSDNLFMLLNGKLTTIKECIVVLGKTGDGIIHIVTAYPKYEKKLVMKIILL